jgi:hypothetical protein
MPWSRYEDAVGIGWQRYFAEFGYSVGRAWRGQLSPSIPTTSRSTGRTPFLRSARLTKRLSVRLPGPSRRRPATRIPPSRR